MIEELNLSAEEMQSVDELHKSIKENGELGNDIHMILYQGIQAMKNNLFYASIGCFTVFLEKFLRDTLIIYEYGNNKTDTSKETLMQELDEIEEKIEDGKGKEYYSFSNICKKLCEYKIIEQNIVYELNQIYSEIRIPIQHGIYGRFIKKELGEQVIPVGEIKISSEDSSEDLLNKINEGIIKPFDKKLNLHTSTIRPFVLPELFKRKSFYLLSVINNLLKIIKKETK